MSGTKTKETKEKLNKYCHNFWAQFCKLSFFWVPRTLDSELKTKQKRERIATNQRFRASIYYRIVLILPFWVPPDYYPFSKPHRVQQAGEAEGHRHASDRAEPGGGGHLHVHGARANHRLRAGDRRQRNDRTAGRIAGVAARAGALEVGVQRGAALAERRVGARADRGLLHRGEEER